MVEIGGWERSAADGPRTAEPWQFWMGEGAGRAREHKGNHNSTNR